MDIEFTDEQQKKVWASIEQELNETPWQYIKSDWREIALHHAGKLENRSAQDLLQNADKIYNWLINEKAPLK